MSTRQTSYSAVLGFVLANLRKAKNIEQSTMASRLGLSQSSYSRLEGGKSAFSVDQMFQASDALGIEYEELNHQLVNMVSKLRQNGIVVMPPVRGNASQAQNEGREARNFVVGAALGALLFSLLNQ